MAQEGVIEVEARLKDFISGNLQAMEANIKTFANSASDHLKKPKTASDFLKGQFNEIKDATVSMLKSFGPAALVIGGVTAAFNEMKKSMDMADEIKRLTNTFDLTSNFVQNLRMAAKLADTDVQSLAIGFKSFSLKASEAAKDANSNVGRAFREMNINASGDLQTMFTTAIDYISKLDDQQQKTILATELFGRGWQSVLQIAGDSGGKFRETLEDIDKTTAKMSKETINDLDEAGDSWKKFSNTATVAAGNVAASLLTVGKSGMTPEDRIRWKQYEIELQKANEEINKANDAIPKYSYNIKDLAATTGKYKKPDFSFLLGDKKEPKEDPMIKWESAQRSAADLALLNMQDEYIKNKQKKIQDDIDWEIQKKSEADLLLEKMTIEFYDNKKKQELASIRMKQLETDAYWSAAFSTVDAIATIGAANAQAAEDRKTLATVVAVVEGAMAAVKAWNAGWDAGGGNPYVSPGLAAAYLAASLAVTGAQIAAIQTASYASGTRSARGGLAMVGEFGPELMAVPQGATIYNNSETRNMMGGNSTVNLTLNMSGGSKANSDDVVESMERLSRTLIKADRAGLLEDFKMKVLN